ncbi:hypothetical protein NP233_g2928 [Leucocoprinus birnbaumii]|uniref:Uncharacterized protein n=1 Tax=Leucocoprinus birnbaumii TaxID=56174 RepID=A0AAD5VZB1_9AGAR|nr:hypothetical protein NP233_g2928 [Leucocoprinus birnbaumii]
MSPSSKYAKQLHERIRREFPELRIYKVWDKAVGACMRSRSTALVAYLAAGPHPTAMFEVNTFTPHQTGAFFAWLVVNRGPCSVLVHPNTDDAVKDHTELATWMGTPWPLNVDLLRRLGMNKAQFEAMPSDALEKLAVQLGQA